MTVVDPHRMLACLQLGIIDRDDIIEWADRRIGELAAPPYWLIELSASTLASKMDQEAILRDQTSTPEPTDDEFLGAMAVRLLDQKHHLRDILPMMYERFCLSNRTDMREEQGMIYLIDDELDWEPERGIATAKDFLQKYLPAGRELITQTKS
jgi:hypothetical protein